MSEGRSGPRKKAHETVKGKKRHGKTGRKSDREAKSATEFHQNGRFRRATGAISLEGSHQEPA